MRDGAEIRGRCVEKSCWLWMVLLMFIFPINQREFHDSKIAMLYHIIKAMSCGEISLGVTWGGLVRKFQVRVVNTAQNRVWGLCAECWIPRVWIGFVYVCVADSFDWLSAHLPLEKTKKNGGIEPSPKNLNVGLSWRSLLSYIPKMS